MDLHADGQSMVFYMEMLTATLPSLVSVNVSWYESSCGPEE